VFPVPVSFSRFFSPDYGLMAARLADWVGREGPLAADVDGRVWVYDSGVWRQDAGDVRRRTVALLGERYRPAHYRTVLEFLDGSLERFTVGPVPSMINMRNGLLIWDGDPDPILIGHNAECPSTVQLPVEWDPGARCPVFDAFLESAIPADDRQRAWEVLGYLMMSGNPLQRLFLLSGSGGNGKGVFLNVVRALLGKANMSAVPLQEFSESQFSTAEIFGKLANVCGDIDATFIQNTGRIKELSGDDEMKGERKFGHPFYFRFWGKAIFSANAIPGASDSSRGWLRRWEVIEFPYEPTNPDPTLSRRVTTEDELAGIAVKAVHALRQMMQTRKFSTGESSEKAHAEFAEKANRVIRWINDPDSNVTGGADVFNKGTVLLRAFRAWEEEDSGGRHNPTSAQRFWELARQAGLPSVIKRGQRGFYGLRIIGQVFVKDAEKPWFNRERESAPDVVQNDSAPPEKLF
jgi:putative DNA primase/helicase